MVYDFSSDQTGNFNTSYDGNGEPYTWGYDATQHAGKLTVTNPASGEYVHVFTTYGMPNHGWFEANVNVAAWNQTEFAMFVERSPADTALNNIIAAYFYRDSTVIGYWAANSFNWVLQSTTQKLVANQPTAVRFMHDGDEWTLYLGTESLGTYNIPNVASSGDLYMEWQIDIGSGPQNQVFWFDDVARPNVPTDLGNGGARLASTLKAAAKRK